MIKKHKRLTILVAAILMLTFYILHIPSVKAVTVKGQEQIRIMTYNLRYAASDYEGWQKRKIDLAGQILEYYPDSIGIQEGDYLWMSEEEGLPYLLEDYAYVGVGRDDGDKSGEFSAIFYLKDKYEVIDSGNFWLSETPEVPSYGWDAACRRICTWARLRNRETGQTYTHFNTHLDHEGQIAREESAKLLLAEIEKHDGSVVLTGDFNFMEDTDNYKTIIDSGILDDSKDQAEDSMSHGTMNWFKRINFQLFKPIDFCFVSSHGIAVDTYRVDNSYWLDGKPVSDHYPVIVDMRIDI